MLKVVEPLAFGADFVEIETDVTSEAFTALTSLTGPTGPDEPDKPGTGLAGRE